MECPAYTAPNWHSASFNDFGGSTISGCRNQNSPSILEKGAAQWDGQANQTNIWPAVVHSNVGRDWALHQQ